MRNNYDKLIMDILTTRGVPRITVRGRGTFNKKLLNKFSKKIPKNLYKICRKI